MKKSETIKEVIETLKEAKDLLLSVESERTEKAEVMLSEVIAEIQTIKGHVQSHSLEW